MARFGLGLAALGAAVWMLGAAPKLPDGDALAGKCSCKSASDCTCKKNNCECPRCRKRHAGRAQGA